MIVVGLLIAIGGVVTSGILTDPAEDLLAGTDGSAAEDTVATEAFQPPVNSTALRQAHSERLDAAGSFTYVEEYRVEGTNADGPSRDETVTATFDLDSDRSLTEVSTGEFQRTTYNTDTEQYERIDDSSGDPIYRIPDRDIGPEPYLDSQILGELETMDVEHQKTDEGHVYTASGVDAVSGQFLNADVDSFRSFEFEAVVSEQGVLESFSYQVAAENGDEVITVTRSARLEEIGTTEVREPTWLAEARANTS